MKLEKGGEKWWCRLSFVGVMRIGLGVVRGWVDACFCLKRLADRGQLFLPSKTSEMEEE